MGETKPTFGFEEAVSVINRTAQIFYDTILKEYAIGNGQQFFLINIHANPGISQLELANLGGFDKGTTARAVKKLEAEGYIERREDPSDKRVNHLYIKEAGIPAVEAIHRGASIWRNLITEGMDEQEIELADRILYQIAKRAYFEVRGKEMGM